MNVDKILVGVLISAFMFLQAADTGVAPYTEPWRPQFHFSPARNWTNDPNGPVFYRGEYHLFYQYNPFGDTWGHMSWGHAVSKDMVHWQHLPVALAEENGTMIFSGSVVVDHNTSGFCGRDSQDGTCLVAIYTGHTPAAKRQAQSLAYSNDRGRTWRKFDGNPVLDLGLKDFRDPKVFWYAPERKWVMVVSLATEHRLRFYSSHDLKSWSALSDFGPAGSSAGQWECPDLFELPVEGKAALRKWVLSVNINPGGPLGGSANQYFVGDFDGMRFTNANSEGTTLWADYGTDFYASTSFSGISDKDGRHIWLAWFSNWQNGRDEPTSPWRGVQTVPRVLTLRDTGSGLRLVQKPIRELAQLRRARLEMHDVTVEEANRRLAAFHSATYEVDAEFAGGLESRACLVLRVDPKPPRQETKACFDNHASEMSLDRTHSGNTQFSKSFPAIENAPATRGPRHTMRALVDTSSVELFGDDGEIVISSRIFPYSNATGLQLEGDASTKISLTVWKLDTVWRSPSN